MADEHGLFWNSNNKDRVYDADSFAEWLNHFFTSGVFANELQVTAAGNMNLSVSTGYANCKGKVRFFNQATTLRLDTANATYPRIDTVVVERNDSDRDISLKIVNGTANNNPVAPAPVRSDYVFQLVLAQVYVSAGTTAITQANITDKRADRSVCGIVAGTVKEMDFNQFASQFESYFSQFKSGNEADFNSWLTGIKGTLTENAAGNLLNLALTICDHLKVDIVKQKKKVISASAWSNGYYTITDEDITADNFVMIGPSDQTTLAQNKAWANAVVNGESQSAGTFRIHALKTVPSIDIPVTLAILSNVDVKEAKDHQFSDTGSGFGTNADGYLTFKDYSDEN